MSSSPEGEGVRPAERRPPGRRPGADVIAAILQRYCRCDGKAGESECAVCRIPRKEFVRAILSHFQARRRAPVLDLEPVDRMAILRDVFALADRKQVPTAWIAQRTGMTRQSVYNWKKAGALPGNAVALRLSRKVLDELRRMPDPAPEAEPPRKRTAEERFWDRVQKTEGCWMWTGSRTSGGHGHIRWKGRSTYAHRVVLELLGVDVPEKKWVAHVCGNVSCVRPDHLAVCTPKEAIRAYRRPRSDHVPRDGAGAREAR